MESSLGPQADRIWRSLREQIVSGALAPGTRLPGHRRVAAQFGVAPLTARRVLAELEAEGLVTQRVGHGTVVRTPAVPGVLVVDDDPEVRVVLCEYVRRAGHRALFAAGPEEALALLEREPEVRLVLSDVRMPTAVDGLAFLRRMRQRWPDVPVAAVTGYPDDLAALHGTPDAPVLVISKALHPHQIEELLGLALRPAPGPMPAPRRREVDAA